MEKIRWGELEALWKKTDAANSESPPSHAIIFLHGYGADMHDLAPLSGALPKAAAFCDWFFPNAPLSLEGNPAGRAWFPLDEVFLSKLIQGTLEEHPPLPPQALQAISALSSFVAQVCQRYPQVFLGGFSQGAMLSLEWALNFPAKIKALVLLSAALADPKGWADKLRPPPAFPIFQSHGSLDAVLPLHSALALKKLLEESEADLTFHQFVGGHEIPLEVLQRLDDFLGGHG